jgi:hypothetical protein
VILILVGNRGVGPLPGRTHAQNESVVRLLGAEYAERGVLVRSLEALKSELDELEAGLQSSAGREDELSHRASVLRLNRRLAQRIVDAHRAWIDEVEQEL